MLICRHKIKLYKIPDFNVVDIIFNTEQEYPIHIFQGKCLRIMRYLENEGFVKSGQIKKFLVRNKLGELIFPKK